MHKLVYTVLVLLLVTARADARPLPELNLDENSVTVSGLSSGGFMAVQLQVAFASRIRGAGIVAGGTFNCANGSLWQALYVCMNPFFVRPDARDSVVLMKTMAEQGRLDPIADIASDRIYLFHGRSDDTVDRSGMDALWQMYRLLGVPDDSIRYVTSVDAGHGFVTEQGSVACSSTRPDFLIDCDFDQAGDILKQLYGELSPPMTAPEQNLREFDQSMYAQQASGMDDTAYLYVPRSCEQGERCRLHIALHGCKQGRERIGRDYALLTGYNAWAESSHIVVLYPQAVSVPPPWYNWFAGNPNGCWDWWGYSSDNYLDRQAPQIAAIGAMVQALLED